jgi:hypothetical protein
VAVGGEGERGCCARVRVDGEGSAGLYRMREFGPADGGGPRMAFGPAGGISPRAHILALGEDLLQIHLID